MFLFLSEKKTDIKNVGHTSLQSNNIAYNLQHIELIS